jgi:hypothetical protein
MTSTRTATAKTADDKVFEFNLNAVQAEVELTPFRFMWATPDDPNKRFSMVHMQALDIWPLMSDASNGELGAMLAAFEAAMGDDFAEFKKVPLPQYKLKALFDEYRKHCGADDAGESAASSDS